jgi:hypothetical protein
LAAAAFYPKVDRSVVSLLSASGWSWGCVSAVDSNGRTIWIADAHRDDGKRFVVRADEKLSPFLELERAVCIHLLSEPVLTIIAATESGADEKLTAFLELEAAISGRTADSMKNATSALLARRAQRR